MDSLKALIETFPREYLKGRFDSEANVNAYSVTLFGAEDHRQVMQFDRDLCARLGMRAGMVRVYCKKGTQSIIEGRTIVTTMDKLRFHVNAKDFLRVIGGLSVAERDIRLKHMIKGRAWTPWSKEVREKATGLFVSGLNSQQVSKMLETEVGVKVPHSTIYFWARRGTRSWAEFSAMAETSR